MSIVLYCVIQFITRLSAFPYLSIDCLRWRLRTQLVRNQHQVQDVNKMQTCAQFVTLDWSNDSNCWFSVRTAANGVESLSPLSVLQIDCPRSCKQRRPLRELSRRAWQQTTLPGDQRTAVTCFYILHRFLVTAPLQNIVSCNIKIKTDCRSIIMFVVQYILERAFT